MMLLDQPVNEQSVLVDVNKTLLSLQYIDILFLMLRNQYKKRQQILNKSGNQDLAEHSEAGGHHIHELPHCVRNDVFRGY